MELHLQQAGRSTISSKKQNEHHQTCRPCHLPNNKLRLNLTEIMEYIKHYASINQTKYI